MFCTTSRRYGLGESFYCATEHTANAMSGLVPVIRKITEPIDLRYGKEWLVTASEALLGRREDEGELSLQMVKTWSRSLRNLWDVMTRRMAGRDQAVEWCDLVQFVIARKLRTDQGISSRTLCITGSWDWINGDGATGNEKVFCSQGDKEKCNRCTQTVYTRIALISLKAKELDKKRYLFKCHIHVSILGHSEPSVVARTDGFFCALTMPAGDAWRYV